MVLLVLVAGAELSLGIQLSAFCRDPDSAMVQYAEEAFGAGSHGSNLTRYYVAGQGANQALLDLSRAEGQVHSSVAWMLKYREAIQRTCPEWQPWNVTMHLRAVLFSLSETRRLLGPTHVYAHYRAAVHEFGCRNTVSGLGWLVVCQVLMALVALPALACTASCLLKGLTAERELGHRFDLLPQCEEAEHARNGS